MPAALAHETPPGLRVVVDETSPALAPLDIDVVVSIAPQFVLTNDTGVPVEVLDDDGVAFLRIGPQGVEANLNAAAWYRTNDPFGGIQVPERARDARDSPAWQRIAGEPSWGWFDHRLHPAGLHVPDEVRAAPSPVALADWAVPLRYGDATGHVRGHVEFRPVLGQFVPALRSSAQVADGVSVSVLAGRVPGLFLANASGSPVVVLGAAREPFLRIGPDHVEANVRSPSWIEASRAAGSVPEDAPDPQAPPEWRQVASGASYGWLEFRAVYPDEEPPEPDREQDVVTWRVPVEVGGTRYEVEGVTRWVPTAAPDQRAGAARDPLRLVAVVLLVVVLALGVWRVASKRR